jgi:hypothetical protein
VTLKEELSAWTDCDVAAYFLGRGVGLFHELNFATDTKHVFWTDNPLGAGLHDALLALTRAGVLESRGDPPQFRWRNGYRDPRSHAQRGRDEARRLLVTRLRELRSEAGDPSVRDIATMITLAGGKASHGSVQIALTTGRVSWPMTALVVTTLGGDIAPFRELWTDAQ